MIDLVVLFADVLQVTVDRLLAQLGEQKNGDAVLKSPSVEEATPSSSIMPARNRCGIVPGQGKTDGVEIPLLAMIL